MQTATVLAYRPAVVHLLRAGDDGPACATWSVKLKAKPKMHQSPSAVTCGACQLVISAIPGPGGR